MITFGDILMYITVLFGLFTSIFFLLTLLDAPKRKRGPAIGGKVCVIVPCYNEQNTVGGTIESILDLDYPRKLLEVIVIDDGSTDDTYAVASRYRDRGVTVVRKSNGGKFTALNKALRMTDAEFVGALDADSFVHRKALKRIMPYFGDPDVMAVTPSMKIDTPDTWLQKVQWTEFLLGILLRKAFALLGAVHVTPGPFSIYRKEFFDKHGYYKKAHHTEDIEVALRIQSLNYEIENAHDAYVYTHGPNTFRALWRQRLRWYSGFLRNVEDYRALISRRHGILGTFILPASFLSVLLVIVSLIYAAYRIIHGIWNQIFQIWVAGFTAPKLTIEFSTLFINMNSSIFLAALTFIVGLSVILIAKRIAGERKSIATKYLLFVFTYWLLFGLWWIAAAYNRFSRKKISWGHKSHTRSR